ncbi:Visual pigments are the light-absorbing molecules that mediate vision [Kappamyces sp. JEL0829]|nr:Visual pigments are the light-absorbing molecules that mediate vision [Kappamyces sp. JEL0829]
MRIQIPFSTEQYALLVTGVVTWIVGTVGILLVLFVLSRQPRSAGGLAIIALCLGDLAFIGSGVIFGIKNLMHGQWTSSWDCVINFWLITSSSGFGVMSLAFLAFERYVVICRTDSISVRTAGYILAGIGIFITCSPIPIFFSPNISEEVEVTASCLNCQIAYFNTSDVWVQFMLSIAVIVIFTSQLVVQICYISIYFKYQSTVQANRQKSRRLNSKQMDIKVLKKCAALTATFLVCWTPTLATLIYEAWSGKQSSLVFNGISSQLGGMNSVLNPFLLYYFDGKIKRDIDELFGRISVDYPYWMSSNQSQRSQAEVTPKAASELSKVSKPEMQSEYPVTVLLE